MNKLNVLSFYITDSAVGLYTSYHHERLSNVQGCHNNYDVIKQQNFSAPLQIYGITVIHSAHC